jgi:hypothetical protein
MILAHIRAEAKRKEGEEERKETKKLSVDLLGTDAEWISHHPRSPFHSIVPTSPVPRRFGTRILKKRLKTNPGLTRRTAYI